MIDLCRRLFYVSFVVLAVFVVVNLFIAIVINNLEAVKHEHLAHGGQEHAALAARLERVRRELEEVEAGLR